MKQLMKTAQLHKDASVMKGIGNAVNSATNKIRGGNTSQFNKMMGGQSTGDKISSGSGTLNKLKDKVTGGDSKQYNNIMNSSAYKGANPPKPKGKNLLNQKPSFKMDADKAGINIGGSSGQPKSNNTSVSNTKVTNNKSGGGMMDKIKNSGVGKHIGNNKGKYSLGLGAAAIGTGLYAHNKSKKRKQESQENQQRTKQMAQPQQQSWRGRQ